MLRTDGRREAKEDRGRHAGHIPGDDEGRRRGHGPERRGEPGERAVVGREVMDDLDRHGLIERSDRIRGEDHDDPGGHDPDRVDRAVEHRPAVHLERQFVRPEAGGAAAREDDRRHVIQHRHSVRHFASAGRRGARGPGTWPAGVRTRMPRRSRSSSSGMT